MTTVINQYLILNKKKYFSIAEEFITLTQLFKNETLFEKLNFWIDMVIYPILTLISIIRYNQKLGVFKIMYIHKAVTKWQQYFRYLELKSEIDEWKVKYDDSVKLTSKLEEQLATVTGEFDALNAANDDKIKSQI